MINIPTLIFFLLLYGGYRYFVKPYLIDAPARRNKNKSSGKKEDDKGDFIDYEEVD